MTRNQRSPTILAVDDEPDILVALSDALEADYRILTATSPTEGLAILEAEPEVALIISDQRMPVMTGDRFLAEARKLTQAEAILLTGYADLSAVTAALNAGRIGGYLPKPWEPEALRAMVASGVRRTELARQLQTEQALLRGLMENIPAAVSFKDRAGRFVQLNAAKAEALGASIEACLGRTEAEIGATPEEMADAEREAIRSGRAVQATHERPHASGSTWTEVTFVPVQGADAETEHLVLVERDVTEQKVAEARLRQADKLQALGTLAGGVAHDFNNLLTAILGSLELAERRLPEDTRVRRYLENARLAGERGAALTKRLLSFSRQEESRAQHIDPAECLRGMDDLLGHTLGGAQVDWRLDEDLWPVAIEPDQLELAVLNLCVNARDAMGGGGRMVLSGENRVLPTASPDAGVPAGEYVVIGVSDQGEGMSPDVLSRILEPFFTTKPVGKGTGLGLSMVYSFARRSGGGLQIESQAGVGTTVRLFLPRAEEGEAVEQPPTAASSEWTAGGSGRAGEVLVVDDEPSVRAVTSAYVAELGHRPLEAEDGAEALDLLERRGADLKLAIIDFAMPGMNGVELIERARERQPDLPVVLVTGYAKLEGLPGDLTLLRKPFDHDALGQAITRALRQAERASSSVA